MMPNDLVFDRIDKSLRILNSKCRGQSLNESMKNMAWALRSAHAPEDAAVSLRPLMNYLGLDYKYSKYEAVDLKAAATLRIKDGKFQILVNQGQSSNWRRARFSIAHEIGHFMLILQSGIEFTYDMQSNEYHHKMLETACDVFAQELLIPERYLKSDLELIKTLGFGFLQKKYAISERVSLRAIVDCTSKSSWIVLKSRKDEIRKDINSRVDFCYPIYKSGLDDRIWLPRNFGDNRIITVGEVAKNSHFKVMESDIIVKDKKKRVFLTYIIKQSRLEFSHLTEQNVIITDAKTAPPWI